MTELQVVWPRLVLLWSQEAYGGVQGLSELVISPVKHRSHGCREPLQDSHGVCIVKPQLALVIIHPHSDLSQLGLPDALAHYMQVVVPSRKTTVTKLHAPRVPVSAQFGTLVPALPLHAGVGHAYGPGRAAVDVDFPVTLSGCDRRAAQSTAHLIKLKRMLRS